MKEAVYQGAVIEADQGVDIRDKKEDAFFTCAECNLPVRVHRAGGNQAAHFEHRERNQICSLVHRPDLKG